MMRPVFGRVACPLAPMLIVLIGLCIAIGWLVLLFALACAVLP